MKQRRTDRTYSVIPPNRHFEDAPQNGASSGRTLVDKHANLALSGWPPLPIGPQVEVSGAAMLATTRSAEISRL